jgi:hypothetical protein
MIMHQTFLQHRHDTCSPFSLVMLIMESAQRSCFIARRDVSWKWVMKLDTRHGMEGWRSSRGELTPFRAVSYGHSPKSHWSSDADSRLDRPNFTLDGTYTTRGSRPCRPVPPQDDVLYMIHGVNQHEGRWLTYSTFENQNTGMPITHL